MRAVFSWSYQRLSGPGRLLFRLMGVHFGPDIATPAVVSLAGIPKTEVRPILAELARAHLITERIPGRFAFHDLLRAYAAELAHLHDADDYRSAARHRVLDHYLYTACHADKLLNRHRDRPFPLAQAAPGVTLESPGDHEQALTWFQSEHAVLLAALRQATGFDTHIWHLAWALVSFFEYQGHWRDWRDSQIAALEAAQRLSDRWAQAVSHHLLGRAFIQLGRYDQARIHLQYALDLFGELGDQIGQAEAHRNLSWVLDRQERYEEALPTLSRHSCYSGSRPSPGHGRALNAVGWFHAKLGNHRQALISCQRPLTCNARSAIGLARPRHTIASVTLTAISASCRRPQPAISRHSPCIASSATVTTRLTPWPTLATPIDPSVTAKPPGEPGNGH